MKSQVAVGIEGSPELPATEEGSHMVLAVYALLAWLLPSPDLDSIPPRNRQEPPRGSSLEFKSARGPLSEPARVAKGLESARRPLFEPPRAGCQETRADSSRVQSWAQAWLESARLVHNTSYRSNTFYFLFISSRSSFLYVLF